MAVFAALTVVFAAACGTEDGADGDGATTPTEPAATADTGAPTPTDTEPTTPAEEETTTPEDDEPTTPDGTEQAEADSVVTGVDYAFEADPGGISPGDSVGFVNESDAEAHEMVVWRVTDDDVTLADIQEMLEQDSEAPPPDYLEEAGFAFAMPGETAEQTVTMDEGRYLLICFIPQNAPPELMAEMMESEAEPEIPSEVEADLGPPHAALGMVDLIEVQ